MNGIYSIGVHNLGLCIIIFTLSIYAFMTPLQIRQQKFAKMNAVMSPELQKIQKKYRGKKDQASQMKMQEETMAIYEKYGVSPTGSCLQMLIQIDVYKRQVHSLSPLIALSVYLTLLVNRNLKPGRERIYDRGAYAVKTAGYFVSPAAKFASCMKNGEYHFNSRNPCFMVDSYRNPPSVINNGKMCIRDRLQSSHALCKRGIWK